MSKFLLISTALVLAVLAANADAFCCPWTLNQVGVPNKMSKLYFCQKVICF